MTDIFIDVDELAAVLKISSYTIRKWARDGDIPAHKIGAEWRFQLAEVLRTLGVAIDAGSEITRKDK